MLEYISSHATELIAMVIALCGATTAVATLIKTLATGNRTIKRCEDLENEVRVTKESIVDAFKNTRFPSEWKVDVSRKIDNKLNEWIAKLEKSDELKTRLIIYMAKILSKSSAYNKLTEAEKDELDKLIAVVSNIEIE